MGRYSGKTCRLLCMLGLTSSFFLVEIIVGYLTHSLAMVSDAYHMLSDIVALLVGFSAVRISKMETSKNTFGWIRAEVVGALVNAVFLIALCFTILVEAIQRLVNVDEIKNPNLLLIVGSLGLAINLVGLLLFHGHAHSHGSSHSNDESLVTNELVDTIVISERSENDGARYRNSNISNGINNSGDAQISDSDVGISVVEVANKIKSGNVAQSAQLNMRGVFLHILGDALGSVIVIISALIVKFVKDDWKHRIDPAMSIFLVGILLATTIPLLRESAFILLQTVPTHLSINDMEKRLIKQVPGILTMHEFHVWQLAGNRIIATAHIRCNNLNEYTDIAEKVKDFFHREGIHSTTIQPEFLEIDTDSEIERECALECGPDKNCHPNTCCARKK